MNYGEGDRILTLFTRDYGKFTVIAKGVRKPKSRKRGHVELFSHIKTQIVNSRGMKILTEAETVSGSVRAQGFRLLHGQLNRLFYAYQFAELIDRLMPEEEPNGEAFELLLKSFQFINLKANSFKLKAVDGYFKNRLVRILGFWPSDRSVPRDVDLLLNEILERPLNSTEIWRGMEAKL
jgi:DNA repair protein RecO (recombination protein O)